MLSIESVNGWDSVKSVLWEGKVYGGKDLRITKVGFEQGMFPQVVEKH